MPTSWPLGVLTTGFWLSILGLSRFWSVGIIAVHILGLDIVYVWTFALKIRDGGIMVFSITAVAILAVGIFAYQIFNCPGLQISAGFWLSALWSPALWLLGL